jgi:hypothetical protein
MTLLCYTYNYKEEDVFMSALTKRATVYLDPDLHRAIKLKAVSTSLSVSDLINRALRIFLSEDAEDLKAFSARKDEALIAFEKVLEDLKRDGKL